MPTSDDSHEPRSTAQEAALLWLIQEVRTTRIEIAELRSALDNADIDLSLPPGSARSDPTTRLHLSPRATVAGNKPRARLKSMATSLHAWWLGVLATYLERGKRAEWAPPGRIWIDIASLAVLTTLALLLRVVKITSIPPGMHGDEAATGLSARQIMDQGWIGVYSGIAGGNPTGDYYLAVPFVKWIHDPVLAVRLFSALGGTLAVVLLYLIVRRNAGYMSAVIATFLFAVSEWAIQFARLGMVTGNWLPFALLGVFCLLEAMRSQDWYWWVAAGLALPSAIYIYNGHLPVLLLILPVALVGILGWRAGIGAMFLIPVLFRPGPATIVALVAGIALIALSRSVRSWKPWVNLAALLGPVYLVSRGMIRFARAHDQDYFGRSRNLSVFKTDGWKEQLGYQDQFIFLLKRYELYWDRMTFHPIPNGADLSGITPLIPSWMLLLGIAGLILSITMRPSWLVLISALVVCAAPWSSALTDMALRRTLIVVPFACALAGIGSAEVLRLAYAKRRRIGIVTSVAMLAILLRIAQINYRQFFDTTVHSQSITFTFATEYRVAMEYIDTLGPNDYVLFFNDRSGLRYDTGALIAGHINGEDRVAQWGGVPGYSVDPDKGRPVFVLMGDHRDELPAIQAEHPGGTVVIGPTLPWIEGPAFIAYLLPEPPGP